MRSDWLKQRLKELGKTQAGLGELLNLPSSRVAEIATGKRRIQSDELPVVARYVEWPISKVLGMISDPSGFTPNVEDSSEPLRPVTVIGEVEAGVFKDTLEYEPEDQFEIFIPVDQRYARMPRSGLKVRGPSMNQVYPEGSILVIVPVIHLGDGYEPRSGQRVVVQRTNDVGRMEATVKELQIDGDNKAWLWPRSTHPEFQQPWRVPEQWDGNGDFDEHSDNLRITALVIGSYKPE